MGIVGDKPESGVRLELERPREGGPPWEYTGRAATPDGEWPVRATIDAAGAVEVVAPKELETKVLLILRTAFKHGAGAPPRKIVRWRGEK
jgi:hypothetical protein